jgi:hypothetical protein
LVPSDFIDEGALRYAYSNPEILEKISEKPISINAGICQNSEKSFF